MTLSPRSAWPSGHPLVDAIAETLLSARLKPSQAFQLYLHLGALCVGAVSFARRIARYGPYSEDYLRDHLGGLGITEESASSPPMSGSSSNRPRAAETFGVTCRPRAPAA